MLHGDSGTRLGGVGDQDEHVRHGVVGSRHRARAADVQSVAPGARADPTHDVGRRGEPARAALGMGGRAEAGAAVIGGAGYACCSARGRAWRCPLLRQHRPLPRVLMHAWCM